jgi:hypothetical protein
MKKCKGANYTNIKGYTSVCLTKDEVVTVSLDSNKVERYNKNSKMYKLILKEIKENAKKEENQTTQNGERKSPTLKSFFAWACFWCRR